ncbi:energy-coupling factor ABC transporter ATP-binding protein [Acetonema longum]|uniref:ABC transporter n=1 Tax=Acetonema longum DSM 6540 TaxID=1009370 RepID=F7NJ15_9FIRM|nr:ABC transporter ATP-binding protein [Acetonema longum]EGO64012.1 ABC transporter [Acetonema longum DSM 6540]
MLELRNVRFSYSRDQAIVVKDVSLQLAQGEFVAVAGRNGSGKTTLTKLMMSLLKPTAGQILYDGRDTVSCSPADMARYIGYVFQNPDRQMFRDTVAAEIAYGPEQLGFPPEKVHRVVDEAMETVGITFLAARYPRTLSKGLKQKVAVASALAMEPAVLILDEPTSGQDVRTRELFMQLLTRLRQAGKTIILVTHDMDCLVRYAQRVIVMADGEKAFDGPVAEFFATCQQVESLGLREPAAVKISRGLSHQGIPLTTDAVALGQRIQQRKGGEIHA